MLPDKSEYADAAAGEAHMLCMDAPIDIECMTGIDTFSEYKTIISISQGIVNMDEKRKKDFCKY